MTFETKGDRTLFFRPAAPGGQGRERLFRIKLKLYTLFPGQVAHDATRKAVLSRAPMVWCSWPIPLTARAISNFESFDNLEKNAGRVGLDFENLPLGGSIQ